MAPATIYAYVCVYIYIYIYILHATRACDIVPYAVISRYDALHCAALANTNTTNNTNNTNANNNSNTISNNNNSIVNIMINI